MFRYFPTGVAYAPSKILEGHVPYTTPPRLTPSMSVLTACESGIVFDMQA